MASAHDENQYSTTAVSGRGCSRSAASRSKLQQPQLFGAPARTPMASISLSFGVTLLLLVRRAMLLPW